MTTVIAFIPPPKGWQRHLKRIQKEEAYSYDFEYHPEITEPALKKADAVLTAMFKRDFLECSKKLKFVQIPFSGTDRIAVRALKKKGIVVANSHENALTVAEHGMLLLLSLTKRAVLQDRDLRKGIWQGFVARDPNTEVYGKTLGIIGLGSIGQEMARRAKSFGMRVIGTKRDPNKGREKLAEIVDEIYSPSDLDTVIKESAFVFLSLPLSKRTEGLIGERELKLMKGKYLINISRGKVVEEEALYHALKNKVLTGAAIDTWYVYPQTGTTFAFPSRYPFHQLDNVIMSPHSAGYTVEGQIRHWMFSFRNIAKFFKDGSAENIVKM